MVLVFGLIYIFRTSFMPYHREAVQRQWHEIDNRMQQLLLALMNALGMAWLSSFFFSLFLLIILLTGPAIVWPLATFQAFYLFSVIAPVFVAIRLQMKTGAKTPVSVGIIAAALSLVGFICILLS